MRIIILGYSGLIGSHILEVLVNNLKKNHNFDLICVGRNIINQPFKNKKIKYVSWNFLELNKFKLHFSNKENIIINCVGKNFNNSEDLQKTNVLFVKKLISYIKYNKVSVRFIHLGSVSVYGAEKQNINKIVNITENSQTNPDDLYSKSKLESEVIIRNFSKKNRTNFSFTILRIANVFSDSKNSNSFRLIKFLLKKGIWFNCSNRTNYHFIHAKDIALAVHKCILYLKKSKNKIYIISEDINQLQLHKNYSKRNFLKLIKIPISLKLLNFIISYISLPKKILNFILTISSQVNYDNNKMKKELNFTSSHSLRRKF